MNASTTRTGLVAFLMLIAAAATSAPPANDLCTNPTGLTIGSTYLGNSNEATPDGVSTCANSGNSPDVWFQLTVANGGLYTLSTCGSSFDTSISLHYAGCPATAASTIACNDDSLECGTDSRLEVYLDPGSYLVRVAGYNGATGNFALRAGGPRIDENQGSVACPELFEAAADSFIYLSPVGSGTHKSIGGAGVSQMSGLVHMSKTGLMYTVGHTLSNVTWTLVAVDPATGAGTRVADLDLPAINSFRDFAERPSDGRLFAVVTLETFEDVLVTIDTVNGHTTVVGSLGTPALSTSSGGLTFAPDGTLYYSVGGNLKTISDTTAATLETKELHYFFPAGLVDRPALKALDTDPQSGQVWAVVNDVSFGSVQLGHVDPATGFVTYWGSAAPNASGLAFFCRCSAPDPAKPIYPANGATDVGLAELNAGYDYPYPIADEFKVTFKWTVDTAQPPGQPLIREEPEQKFATEGSGIAPETAVVTGGYGTIWSRTDINTGFSYSASSTEIAQNIFFAQPTTIESVNLFVVDTGVWDQTIRYTIYRDSGTGVPGPVIIAGSPASVFKSVYSGIIYTAQFYLATPVTLPPGRYWISYNLTPNCTYQDTIGISLSIDRSVLEYPTARNGCAGNWTNSATGADLVQQLYGYTDECSRAVFDVYLDTVNPPLKKVAEDLTLPVLDYPTPFQPGKTYYWRVVSKASAGDTVGPVWSFHTFDPVPNDACADALLAWPGKDYVINNTNTVSEPGTNCGRRDLWFTYTPSANGMAAFHICQEFKGSLSVYDGCPGAGGSQLGCDSDGFGSGCGTTYGNDVSVPVTTGQHYWIKVGGTGTGSHGPMTFNFTGPTPLYDGRPFGDLDNSGCTDLTDFLLMLDYWLQDLNGTPVGIEDFLGLLDYWQLGPNC